MRDGDLGQPLSSHFLDASGGGERMRFAVGQRFYFEDQRVTLPNEAPRSASTSDVLIGAEGRLSDAWLMNALVQFGIDFGWIFLITYLNRYLQEVHDVPLETRGTMNTVVIGLSLPALILPQIGVSVSLGTFWMRAFFRSAPRSVIEAARVDGAGSLRTLTGVLVPAARPAILTLAVLIFMYTWNEFLLALVMNPSGKVYTAPLALSFFAGSQRITDQTVVAAGAVLVAVPVILFYVVLQRQFIRGFLTGAVRE